MTSWISCLNVRLSPFVSCVFVRCGGLPQSSQRRVFPGPGLSRALSLWRNGGGLLEPQTHKDTPSPAWAHHWPVRDTHFSLQTHPATPSITLQNIQHSQSHLTNSFGVTLSQRPHPSLLSSDYGVLCPAELWWMNVRGLSQAINHSAAFSLGRARRSDNAFALVFMCRGHIRVFPLQSHQLESSVTLSLSLSLGLSAAQWLQLAPASTAAYL